MLIAQANTIIMHLYYKHGGQRGYRGHVLNLLQDVLLISYLLMLVS